VTVQGFIRFVRQALSGPWLNPEGKGLPEPGRPGTVQRQDFSGNPGASFAPAVPIGDHQARLTPLWRPSDGLDRASGGDQTLLCVTTASTARILTFMIGV
jgi:hypothetical protein